MQYRPGGIHVETTSRPRPEKQLVGVDVFVDWSRHDRDPERLGGALEAAAPAGWRLKVITNRSVKVYPDGLRRPSAPITGAAASCRPRAGRSSTPRS